MSADEQLKKLSANSGLNVKILLNKLFCLLSYDGFSTPILLHFTGTHPSQSWQSADKSAFIHPLSICSAAIILCIFIIKHASAPSKKDLIAQAYQAMNTCTIKCDVYFKKSPMTASVCKRLSSYGHKTTFISVRWSSISTHKSQWSKAEKRFFLCSIEINAKYS
jgi:hypothetical protein